MEMCLTYTPNWRTVYRHRDVSHTYSKLEDSLEIQRCFSHIHQIIGQFTDTEMCSHIHHTRGQFTDTDKWLINYNQ